MVLRFLLLFVLACLFFLLVHALLSRGSRRRNLRSQPHRRTGEEMVLDPQCQSYVPKSDAISRNGLYFCSEECAKLYLKDEKNSF